jgi:hypothetical protein
MNPLGGVVSDVTDTQCVLACCTLSSSTGCYVCKWLRLPSEPATYLLTPLSHPHNNQQSTPVLLHR